MATDCTKCNGTGFQLKAGEHGVLSAVRCSCERQGRSNRLLRAARIPKRYDHCTLESFEEQSAGHGAARRTVREWSELWPAVRHGLLLLGTPGTGKTHLVVALAKELICTKSAQVLFYEQRELLKALQGTFDAASPQRESEVLGPILDAEVLVLDDLGAGRTTAWARDVLHDIIGHRYNTEKPLIMTSNHATGDEPGTRRPGKGSLDAPLTLRDRLGDALMSRIYEMCRIVRLSGKDYRSEILNAEHQPRECRPGTDGIP